MSVRRHHTATPALVISTAEQSTAPAPEDCTAAAVAASSIQGSEIHLNM
jgi:hypothetical protein